MADTPEYITRFAQRLNEADKTVEKLRQQNTPPPDIYQRLDEFAGTGASAPLGTGAQNSQDGLAGSPPVAPMPEDNRSWFEKASYAPYEALQSAGSYLRNQIPEWLTRERLPEEQINQPAPLTDEPARGTFLGYLGGYGKTYTQAYNPYTGELGVAGRTPEEAGQLQQTVIRQTNAPFEKLAEATYGNVPPLVIAQKLGLMPEWEKLDPQLQFAMGYLLSAGFNALGEQQVGRAAGKMMYADIDRDFQRHMAENPRLQSIKDFGDPNLTGWMHKFYVAGRLHDTEGMQEAIAAISAIDKAGGWNPSESWRQAHASQPTETGQGQAALTGSVPQIAGAVPKLTETNTGLPGQPLGTFLKIQQGVTGNLNRPLGDINNDYQNALMKSQSLEDTLTTNRAANYTWLIPRSGAMKGEISTLTINQYYRLNGRMPSKASLTPDGKHVKWEYALDDAATQAGYANGDEFRKAIQQAQADKKNLIKLKSDALSYQNEIQQAQNDPRAGLYDNLQEAQRDLDVANKVLEFDPTNEDAIHTKDIATISVEDLRSKQSAPGTSVQTGLPGMPVKAPQAQMFGEFGGAGGAGQKPGLMDAAALQKQTEAKAEAERLKALGQQELPAIAPPATPAPVEAQKPTIQPVVSPEQKYNESAKPLLEQYNARKQAIQSAFDSQTITRAEYDTQLKELENYKNEQTALLRQQAGGEATPPKPPEAPQVTVPPEPPKELPKVAGQPQPPKPQGQREIDRILDQSREVVKQDRPGTITQLAEKIPGLKQVLQGERPGLKMTGESERILVGMVATRAVQSDVATRAFSTRLPLFKRVEDAFGHDALTGGKTNVTFVGTSEQAKNSITGTLLDIAQNPELYQLSAAHKQVLTDFNDRNTALLNDVVTGYGAEIGEYPAHPGGMYISNVDTPDELNSVIESEMRAVSAGRGKTRIWDTARDRMAGKTPFKPITNFRKLIEGMDRSKANAAMGKTFFEALGGKTRLEAMQETHPELYKKMTDLRGRLQSLRGGLSNLDSKQADAIDAFLKSSVEGTDVVSLQAELNPSIGRAVFKTKEGNWVTAKPGVNYGKNAETLEDEISTIKGKISALRPAWEAANLKPYVFIQNGIYRYFPAPDARLITESLKTTDSGVIKFLQDVKSTAFSGDLSPILGVQAPLGVLFDPAGSVQTMYGGLKAMGQDKDIFRPYSMMKLAEDIHKDPDRWAKYFSLIGHVPGGTPEEYAGGFMKRIPGFTKATEATYLIPMRMGKASFERMTESLIRGGVPRLAAEAAAASKVGEIYPMMNPARLGQSQQRNAQIGSIPTSYAFIRQPANMMIDAAKGYFKMGTLQRLTPREKLSVNLVTTMALTALVTAALSAMATAKAKGKDDKKVLQAALDAINPDPNNGKFLSVIIGDYKIPLGGPYRALFRAMYPQKVFGSPVPLPFGGLMQFLDNRLTPVISRQIDLLKNKDYYSKPIYGQEFPKNIAQILGYELEGVLPLTFESLIENFKNADLPQDAVVEAVGQFAGTNVTPAEPQIRRIERGMARLGTEDIKAKEAALAKAVTAVDKQKAMDADYTYTTPDLAQDIKWYIQDKTAAELKQEDRLPPIAIYLKEWQEKDREYQQIYDINDKVQTRLRDAYKKLNPDYEIMRMFWDGSAGKPNSAELAALLGLAAKYNIPAESIPAVRKKMGTVRPPNTAPAAPINDIYQRLEQFAK